MSRPGEMPAEPPIAAPLVHPASARLPRWITGIGWACVAGCAVFATSVASDILEVGDREVMGGFVDYFLPGPRALGMLLWELSFVWVFIVGHQLFRLWRKGATVRHRDRILGASLLVGFVLGRLLVVELARRGVHLGIPGVDH